MIGLGEIGSVVLLKIEKDRKRLGVRSVRSSRGGSSSGLDYISMYFEGGIVVKYNREAE